jgi:hypothetical protein
LQCRNPLGGKTSSLFLVRRLTQIPLCGRKIPMSRVSVRYIIDDVPAAMRF